MIDEVQLAAKQAEDEARLWQMHGQLKAEAERLQAADAQTGRELTALVGDCATVLAEIGAGGAVEPELAGLLCRALDADGLWRRLHKLPRREGYQRARMQLWAYYADCLAREALRELFRAGAVSIDAAGQLGYNMGRAGTGVSEAGGSGSDDDTAAADNNFNFGGEIVSVQTDELGELPVATNWFVLPTTVTWKQLRMMWGK